MSKVRIRDVRKMPKVLVPVDSDLSPGEETLAFHVRCNKLPEPVREYHFATEIGRRWRYDFAWPDYMVAAEVEGGSWIGGHHGRGKGFRDDCEKYNHAALRGWLVLRHTTEMVIKGIAVADVEIALLFKGWKATKPPEDYAIRLAP